MQAVYLDPSWYCKSSKVPLSTKLLQLLLLWWLKFLKMLKIALWLALLELSTSLLEVGKLAFGITTGACMVTRNADTGAPSAHIVAFVGTTLNKMRSQYFLFDH